MNVKVAHKLLSAGGVAALAFGALLCWAMLGINSATLRAVILLLAGLLFASAAGILFFTGRRVHLLLGRLIAAASETSAGRLNAAEGLLAAGGERAPDSARWLGDETEDLTEAFRKMIGSLNSPLRQLRSSGADVSGFSIQLAASVKELEAAAVAQAAATDEVRATSRQIFGAVQDLAGSMRSVQQMASEAASLASAGMDALKNINSIMSELRDSTVGITSVLRIISERASDITQVVTTITNIANRTNLVSLNAAIEAEKAGAQAAGFSVVAVEIRRLADQTCVAALDIEKMVGEMQSAVKHGVVGVSGYAERAHASSEMVASITTDLGRLIEHTRQLEPHFEVVNNGMQMQTAAAGQILEAMQHLADNAAHTRDSLRQFRGVAGQMRSVAEMLQSEVGRFSAGA